MAPGVCCRNEEHGGLLNESAVLVGKGGANGDLLKAVSQLSGLTGVLESLHPIVIQRIVGHASVS